MNLAMNGTDDSNSSIFVSNFTDPWQGFLKDRWLTARRWDQTSIYIGFIGLVITMPVGMILNILCVIIFAKNNMSTTAVGLHLILLGMADSAECFSAIFIAFWGFGRYVIPGYLYPVDR